MSVRAHVMLELAGYLLGDGKRGLETFWSAQTLILFGL